MAIRKSSTSGVPFGNTANRPANPTVGQTYYNGELGYQEIYTNAGWIPATGGNDFNLNITSAYTTVTFSQSFAGGSYSIVSSSNDSTLDIYAYAADGSLAGYTATKAFTATQRFNKMVVIGGTVGDVLSFSYKTTFATSATTSETAAGPFITSVSPSAMPNANDTITITGGNFANDVQVAFTGSGYSSTQAKNIVRSSASSLIVTRPDNFPISASPYTITITNPGVSAPAATLANISSNSITAGTTPVWNTAATLPTFTRNSAYSTVLSATDPDTGGSITYSLVSGSLPTGLTLSSLTGGISGTPTSDLAVTFTVRATDAGGNFVDRAFTMPNAAPVWSTAATLSTFTRNVAYSTTVVATDDSGNNPTYSLVSGSLPTGLSLSSAGVISGTPTSSTVATFTIRATDVNGNTADRAFTMPNAGPVWVTSSLSNYLPSASNSYTLVANDDSGVSPTYSLLSGSLPTGLSLSSAGLITGTAPSSGTFNFTVRATDANGTAADRSFSLAAATPTTVSFTSVGTTNWTLPANANSSMTYLIVAGGAGGGDGNLAGGGGGAGGMIEGTSTFSPGTTYTITVGAGGSGGTNDGRGSSGGNSSIGTIVANGGGAGGGSSAGALSGGSGGGGGGPSGNNAGAGATIGSGIPSGGTGYGNSGGSFASGGNWGAGGAGGGAGGAGASGSGSFASANGGGSGRTSSITGSSQTYSTGGGGANAGGNGANATVYGGGGGASGDQTAGSGRQGIVVITYYT